MRTQTLNLILAASALALTGCAHSSKFACPNRHGVTCMSTQDIYKATNSADEIVGIDPREARELSREGRPAGRVESESAAIPASTTNYVHASEPTVIDDRRVIGTRLEGDTLLITGVSTAQDRGMTGERIDEPVNSAPYSRAGEAYLEPARVMSVYVRPYEDENGDLHLGSYVKTEIEPRKWAVAEKGSAGDGYFQLLNPPQKAQETAAKPESDDEPTAAAAASHPKSKGATP